jgi:predicted aspartyl protease
MRDFLFHGCRWPVRSCAFLLAAFMIAAYFYFNASVAGAQEQPSANNEIQLYSTPDESSLPLESIKPGESLSPAGELIGAGGVKWFMVRSKSGTVGWLKADKSELAKKIESHFKSLPKESMVIPSNSAARTAGTVFEGQIAIPVNARGSHVIVPVTFNGSVTARLFLDTGAGRTMISKRIARDLRLLSLGPAVRYGVGGAVTVATAKVDSVRVGDAEVANMEVSIHDFSPDPSIEGLLGFDFLRYFNVSIDVQRQLLVLAPRKP